MKSFYSKFSIRSKLGIIVIGFVAAITILAAFSFLTIERVKVNGTLYHAIVTDKDIVADILPPPMFIIDSYLTAYQLIEETDPARQGDLISKLKSLKTGPGGYDERLSFWKENELLEAMPIREAFLEKSRKPVFEFFEIVEKDFIPAIQANDTEKARAILLGELKGKFEEHRRAIDEVVDFVNKDYARVENETDRELFWRNVSLLATGLVLIGLTIFFVALPVAKDISDPIIQGVKIAENIASGDLTQDVPSSLVNRNDEIGSLSKAMQTMTGNLRRIIGNITGGVKTISDSSRAMMDASVMTSQSVVALSDRTCSVASAAEESSTNASSMAETMSKAAYNLTAIAAAAEEMSVTIEEVASNTERARSISVQAGKQTTSVYSVTQQLDKAVRDISKINEAITEISSQTNLLALNASIEASRAGDAGKGFAVVAKEIKDLAKQTADATEVIDKMISEVQVAADTAMKDIYGVKTVVEEVEQLVVSIASSIEEQTAVVRELAANVSQVSEEVQDTNTKTLQTADVSKSIAQEIAFVDASVGDIRSSGENIRKNSEGLLNLVEQLNELAAEFRS